MQEEVAARLQRLNLEFYQTFAEAFASTRRRLQPGVQRALRAIPQTSSVLDLGCGTGELARGLARHGHRGTYLGIDASRSMLDLASERVRFPWASFLLADLTRDEWAEQTTGPFDRIFLLAALHHIPGDELRRRVLARISTLLASSGALTLSVWDFSASPRMRRRIVAWDVVGLTREEVDPGDYLLDWRHGGLGLRYVHLFTEDELKALARRTGFEVANSYRSDGEGGRQGVYHVWARCAVGLAPNG